MKKIMILGASVLQLPAIEKAKEMGLEVIALDINPLAVGFSVPGTIKEVVSTIDTPNILETARKHRIDGIMTLATDMPMQSVAVVSQELGLVGISEDTALKATNKAFMREALRDAGVPIPIYYRVRRKKDFNDAIDSIVGAGYKCIVKPADNSGSRGVRLLDGDSDRENAYEYALKFSRGGEIVVEEYMEGPEVSVETLAIDGDVHVIQITDKITTGAPYFVEMGHTQPSRLDEDVKARIAEITIAANKAIGIKDGPSHTEIIVTKGGPKIVELGARMGGDCIATHLVPLSTGVDMVECCIRIALGEKPDIVSRFKKGSAIRYLDVSQGEIERISRLDEAEAVEGIRQVSIVHKVGETINEIRNSGDRVGFVIAQGKDADEAASIAEKARDLIKVEIKHDL